MTKRAVSFGINYFGTASRLNGCINDTKSIKELLVKVFDYKSEDILVITDAAANQVKPTRDVIIQTLKDLVAKTKAGDTLFVHYSGHGTYTKDRSLAAKERAAEAEANSGASAEGCKKILTSFIGTIGTIVTATRVKSIDEPDARDEMICPCEGEYIRDDELYEILVKPFPKGAKLRVIFDCCHSGSGIDLPLRCNDSQGIVRENDRVCEDSDIIMISGCRDDQTSADAYISGGYKGALTWGFTKVCNNLQKSRTLQVNRMSWKQLITVLRYTLRNEKYEQIAQLSATNAGMFDKFIDL